MADQCRRKGRVVILGDALYRRTLHGGKAKKVKIDSLKITMPIRGTRDLMRRRMHLMCKRAARLEPIRDTTRQHSLSEIGKNLRVAFNRDGIAERLLAPGSR